MRKFILCPSCSEWTGRLNNREYKDEYSEYIDEKTGKKEKYLEHQDYDISIPTDTFPNQGLQTAIGCIKDGFDIDSIEWDNVGGGANSTMLEKDFEFARKIVDSGIELDGEEIDILDGMIWRESGDGESYESEFKEMFSKLDKGSADDFALKLVKMDTVFGRTLLKLEMLKQKTKDEIAKILVAERLLGEKNGD